MKFYVAENEKPVGPFEVSQLVARGLKGSDLVWAEGYETWVRADSVDEIKEALAAPSVASAEAYRETAIPQLPNENTVPGCPPPPYQQPYQQQPNQPQQQSYVAPPQSGLVESILVTLLCCLPFGIVGIVNAANVNSQWSAGRYEEAEKSSANAKRWTIIGAITGFVVSVLYIILIVFAGVLGNLE